MPFIRPPPSARLDGEQQIEFEIGLLQHGRFRLEQPDGRVSVNEDMRNVTLARDSVDRARPGIFAGREQARPAWREIAARHMAGLTQRQKQIMDLVLDGGPSKNIAADLGISQRTAENHRAAIMKRTGVKSLPALARLALAATS